MCSIAGFSLSENSRINPRRLSKALFVEMDSRGNQAAGFAWQSESESGVYKNATSGASLSMKPMAKGARVAVLHTRYATHGTIKNMANNHPVLSPDKSISLVHNGVIYNHTLVRKHLDAKLPEVDTSVIPAILEQFDRDLSKLNMLEGDASIAWLDENDRLTLQVARVSHSPLCVAQTADGSLVFASTERMLLNALESAGLSAVYMENVPEYTLLTVRNGRLDNVEQLPETAPEFEDTFQYSTSTYRNMTSGGHSSWSDTPASYTEYGTGQGRSYDSPWGAVEVPASWFESSFEDANGFPVIEGYKCNEFGEYFDKVSGLYVGSYDDFVSPAFDGRSSVAYDEYF